MQCSSSGRDRSTTGEMHAPKWSGWFTAQFQRHKKGWKFAGSSTLVVGGAGYMASQPGGSLAVDLHNATVNASTGAILAVGVALAVPVVALTGLVYVVVVLRRSR